MKIKLFFWLAANDKIHTWDIFLRRGWIDSNMCFLCRCNWETVYHLFWDCPTTKTIWHNILTALNSNLLWMGTNLQDCMENWSSQVTNFPHLPVIVCWYVWNSRKKTIFHDVSVFIFAICFQIMRKIGLEKIKKPTAPRFFQPLLQLSGNLAWFDGASQHSGLQCGAGERIHLCDGSRITWTLNCGSRSNTKAELLGVWVTLFLVSHHNILDLHV